MGSPGPAITATPVAESERLVALDLIRGLAVLGILLANITGFSHPSLAYYWPGALPGGGNAGDHAVWLAQFVLIDGKLRALFTILFGAGLVLFVERLGGDRDAVGTQIRRLGWLALFGLLHFYLLFTGDILFSYACGGLIALPFLQMRADRAVVLGVIWLLVAGLFQTLSYLTPMLVEQGLGGNAPQQAMTAFPEYWTRQLDEAARESAVMSGDSLWQLVQWRLAEQSGQLVGYFSWAFFETVPLILIGMGLYRMGLFGPAPQPHDDEEPVERTWRRMWLAWIAVMLGGGLTLASGLAVMQAGFPPLLTQFVFFGSAALTNVPLILGLALLLGRWAVRAGAAAQRGWLVDRLVLAGRMAFTNYLGTSLVMALVFQGWAGGLFGQMHRVELLLVVLMGWAMMLAFSRLWLARFRYGPLEWLWRCLTYWKLFPNRLPL